MDKSYGWLHMAADKDLCSRQKESLPKENLHWLTKGRGRVFTYSNTGSATYLGAVVSQLHFLLFLEIELYLSKLKNSR